MPVNHSLSGVRSLVVRAETYSARRGHVWPILEISVQELDRIHDALRPFNGRARAFCVSLSQMAVPELSAAVASMQGWYWDVESEVTDYREIGRQLDYLRSHLAEISDPYHHSMFLSGQPVEVRATFDDLNRFCPAPPSAPDLRQPVQVSMFAVQGASDRDDVRVFRRVRVGLTISDYRALIYLKRGEDYVGVDTDILDKLTTLVDTPRLYYMRSRTLHGFPFVAHIVNDRRNMFFRMFDGSIYRCEHCNRFELIGEGLHDRICTRCEDDFESCAECGDPTHQDNMDADGWCSSCADSNDDEDGIKYKPRRGVSDFTIEGLQAPKADHADQLWQHVAAGMCEFNGDPMQYAPGFRLADKEKKTFKRGRAGATTIETTRYFGVELEMVPRNGTRREKALRELWPVIDKWAIFKSDGSVDAGMEMVTVPATLAAQRIMWRSFFAVDPAKMVRGWGARECGLHVHVSKLSLGMSALGRLLVFMGEDDNQKFLTHFAGREPNTYCAKVIKNKGTPRDVQRVQYAGRYQALNTDTGHGTIEFRLFQSNVTERGVMRVLDFCDAVCEFADNNPADAMRASEFVLWAARHRGRWPWLNQWLEKAGYLVAKHKPREPVNPLEEIERDAA